MKNSKYRSYLKLENFPTGVDPISSRNGGQFTGIGNIDALHCSNKFDSLLGEKVRRILRQGTSCEISFSRRNRDG